MHQIVWVQHQALGSGLAGVALRLYVRRCKLLLLLMMTTHSQMACRTQSKQRVSIPSHHHMPVCTCVMRTTMKTRQLMAGSEGKTTTTSC